VASIANRLRGACANVAASDMRTRARNLEEAARRGKTAEIEENWRQLQRAWGELDAAISKTKDPGEVVATN
jgi:HPt (histidine-containing phosphotransfer) domain-containing protein